MYNSLTSSGEKDKSVATVVSKEASSVIVCLRLEVIPIYTKYYLKHGIKSVGTCFVLFFLEVHRVQKPVYCRRASVAMLPSAETADYCRAVSSEQSDYSQLAMGSG